MSEVTTSFDAGDAIGLGDIQAYIDVIREAFAVHVDRERIRRGLWKEYPAGDQANQIKIKIDRVLRSLEQLGTVRDVMLYDPEQKQALRDNAIEEMFDIINYANFTVRKLRGEV